MVLECRAGNPELESLVRTALMRELLGNCFTPHLAAQELVAQTNRLAGVASGYRLRYFDNRQAAQTILGLEPAPSGK